MLHASMMTWNVESGIMYRCEKKILIYDTFIDCMKVRTDQWQPVKRG
jgi:hypothetical protein